MPYSFGDPVWACRSDRIARHHPAREGFLGSRRLRQLATVERLCADAVLQRRRFIEHALQLFAGFACLVLRAVNALRKLDDRPVLRLALGM